MIQTFMLMLLLIFSPTLLAADTSQPIAAPVANEWFTLEKIPMSSTDGQRHYQLLIAVPRQPAAKQGYPVLYLTDGNALLPQALAAYTPDMGAAPLIVAIGYPVETAYSPIDRTRDYTPPAAGEEFAAGGGAEHFYQFIVDQVKPLIEQRYPVNVQKQTLAGHSFGGLFTLYVLFNHSMAFQHYVAASPSIWWGDGIVLPHRTPLISTPVDSVTLTVGEYEEKPDPALAKHQDPQRQKVLAKRRQVTRARELAEILKQQGSQVQFILFPGKNHGSVVPEAMHSALLTAINSENVK